MTQLDVHPVAGLFQLLPELTTDELDELHEDIRRNGVRVPVDVDEDGNIIDGHHRARIADELGIEFDRRVLSGLTDEQKRGHALAVNVHRRQLNREQKRELIRASLKADPELSDRQHAERTGSSHPTVAAVRGELEASGDVEKLSTRTDASGRNQPTSRGEIPHVRPQEQGDLAGEIPELAPDPGMPANQEHGDAALEVFDAWSADQEQRPRPPKWDPEDRKRHDEEVARVRDIEAARQQAKTIVTDVVSAVCVVVAGYRYGETGLVTPDMITKIREAIDLLEGEL